MPRLHKSHRRVGQYAIIAAAALLLSSAALAAEPVTFDQSLELAEARAPNLTAKDLERQAFDEEAVAARSLPDPVVSLSIQNKRIDSFRFDDDDMTMKTIGISQEFVRTSKRRARAAAILARAGASQAERALLATQVRAETAIAWTDLYFAQRIQCEIEEFMREAHLDLAGAKASYGGGSGQLSEIVAAQQQIVALENRLTENRSDIEAARARLGRWIGRLDVTVAGSPPDITKPPLDPSHLDHVIEAHPAVAVYGARLRQAEAEARSAISERGLDPTVEITYGQREDRPGMYKRPDMVGVTVSVPLQINRKNRQNRTILARELEVQQVAAEREDALREHRAKITAELAAWRASVERLARYERSLKPLARSQLEAALAAYRGGGSLAILIEARRAQFDVALEALAVEAGAAREWTELYTLTGGTTTHPPLASVGSNSQ